MNSKVYKWCAVPLCKNTSIATPNKLFIYVPNKKTVRDKWLKLARRNPREIVTNSPLYFCEDHFDLPNDMENYMQYHLMGSVSQVRSKPGCIPSKFACQPDRKTRSSDTIERPYIRKKRKMMLLEECEKQLEEGNMAIGSFDIKEVASGSSDCVLMESSQNETIRDPEHNSADMDESSGIIVKCEEETENHDEPATQFENFNIEIKHEFNPDNAILPETEFSTENHTVKIENKIHMDSSSFHDTSDLVPKVEIDNADYPGFHDVGSMDSSEAAPMEHVEACLQDELDIKTEHEIEQKEDYDNIAIKEELTPTITETHLISNKLISTTSTITNPQYGFIESQTTNTLVMEILPISQTGNESLTIMRHDPEEILSTPFSFNQDHKEFQLNSITGDELSLEQQAFMLDNSTEEYKCEKCPKSYKFQYSLNAHIEVHKTIDRRNLGFLKGVATRKKNQEKLLEISIEERMVKKQIKKVKSRKQSKYLKIKNHKSEPIEIKSHSQEVKALIGPVKTGSYVCTCGKVFQRKSRLETCLRSHNESAETSCFPCMTCSKQFKVRDELIQHRKIKHRKRFPCKFCPTDYNTRKELFRHLQIHQKVQLTEFKVMSEVISSKQKIRCPMCTQSFKELSELKVHAIDHKEPYFCKYCKNNFPKFVEFVTHIKTFHPEIQGQAVLDVLEAFFELVKAWKCEECNEQFYEADKFALHQVKLHNTESITNTEHQCPDCRRVFVSPKGLKSHRRIHEAEPAEEVTLPEGMMCLECRKMCNDMTHLTSHMRLHSMDRKYPCKYCDFRFATPEKRKIHAEIHTGDMKFVCFICEYQCTSENRLKQHKLSIKHLNMKEFLLTGKPLIEEPPSEPKIRDTSKKKHKKEKRKSDEASLSISCDICGEKFAAESEMLEHKQTHPFIEFPNEEVPTRIFFK